MDTNPTPESELPWTGERLVPSRTDYTAIEHLHRYSVAMPLAAGKRVLDIASGEGYGSHLLAQIAEHVTGVDICVQTVQHSQRKYQRDNLEFKVGGCAAIPVESCSVDLVVSFETIEHHDKHDEMMREIKRILHPNGILLLSSPNKHVYSDLPKGENPFHVKELYQDELESLLNAHFKSHRLLGQMMFDGSVMFPIDSTEVRTIEIMEGDYQGTSRRHWSDQIYYFIAIATDAAELPPVPAGIYDGKKLQPTRREVTARIEYLQWMVDHLQPAIDVYKRDQEHDRYTISQYLLQYEAAIATLEQKEKHILAVIAWSEQLNAHLKATEEQLLTAVTSPTMNLGRRVERIANRLAPPNSVRRWLFRTTYRSLQKLRQGIRALTKRVAQKLNLMRSRSR